MSALVQVSVHESQFPGNVRRALLESLRHRQVNHRFHYESLKQTQKWLALHQAYSPSRTDPDCAAIYDRCYEVVAGRLRSTRVRLIGIGCGGGQKDSRLLKLLRQAGKEVYYTPIDVGHAMVLVAREAALSTIPPQNCLPIVCDIAVATDLAAVLRERPVAGAARLVTFFGMIPNFEPDLIMPRLMSILDPEDLLLFSANLAPGHDYEAGVRRVLPLYDNNLTRDWLMTFLLDLGVENSDGEVSFVVEEGGGGLKRIAAYFRFKRERKVQIEEDQIVFKVGESIRLFFSYRYTPTLVRELVTRYGLSVQGEWVTQSGEEGVFLGRGG
jgi:uncharacterized SAM-dependent methyltransferase